VGREQQEPVTTLYVVRHGETDWNRERRIQGQQDPPLNEVGRQQARALAGRLSAIRFDAVYSSDLRRARETAEIIAAGRRLPIHVTPALRERSFGRWEGERFEDLPHLDPAGWQSWLERRPDAAPHGGESDAALEKRSVAIFQRIVEAFPGGDVLVVSHGGLIAAMIRAWIGMPSRSTSNCAGYVVEARGDWRALIAEFGPESFS